MTIAAEKLRALVEVKHPGGSTDWDEGKHPRGEGGKFGGGGGAKPVNKNVVPRAAKPAPAPAPHREFKTGHDATPNTQEKFFKNGQWDPSRTAIHEGYAKAAVRGLKVSTEPVVHMTGGGPASGKTSALLKNPLAKFPGEKKAAHINPDAAKESIPEYKAGIARGDLGAAAATHEESSHMAKQAYLSAVKAGHDVVYDSVGDSGIDKLGKKVAEMRAAGAARVEAQYVTIDPKVALEREQKRAASSGRKVAADYFAAAHADVNRTAMAAMKAGTFDAMKIWDNTANNKPRLVAEHDKVNGLKIHDHLLWREFQERAK